MEIASLTSILPGPPVSVARSPSYIDDVFEIVPLIQSHLAKPSVTVTRSLIAIVQLIQSHPAKPSVTVTRSLIAIVPLIQSHPARPSVTVTRRPMAIVPLIHILQGHL